MCIEWNDGHVSQYTGIYHDLTKKKIRLLTSSKDQFLKSNKDVFNKNHLLDIYPQTWNREILNNNNGIRFYDFKDYMTDEQSKFIKIYIEEL